MKSPQKQHVDSTGMKSPQMKSPSGQSTPDTPLNTLWIPCVLGKHVICYTKGKFPDQSLCFAPFWRGFAAFGRHFCKLKSILEATKQIRGPHEVGRSHRYHYLPTFLDRSLISEAVNQVARPEGKSGMPAPCEFSVGGALLQRGEYRKLFFPLTWVCKHQNYVLQRCSVCNTLGS